MTELAEKIGDAGKYSPIRVIKVLDRDAYRTSDIATRYEVVAVLSQAAEAIKRSPYKLSYDSAFAVDELTLVKSQLKEKTIPYAVVRKVGEMNGTTYVEIRSLVDDLRLPKDLIENEAFKANELIQEYIKNINN